MGDSGLGIHPEAIAGYMTSVAAPEAFEIGGIPRWLRLDVEPGVLRDGIAGMGEFGLHSEEAADALLL